MGQKSIPTGLRLGITCSWSANWFAERKAYASFLMSDIRVRKFLSKRLKGCGVSKIVIERPQKSPRITIHSSRPGVIIGKKGAGIEKLGDDLKKEFGEGVSFNVLEVRRPDLYAKLIADDVARQMEQRVSYKRASRRAVHASLRAGAKGVKVVCSGRLGGAEIARREWIREGGVPLHTLRADVDYGAGVAHTSYGSCGVKVFVYRGDAFKKSALSKKNQSKESSYGSGGA